MVSDVLPLEPAFQTIISVRNWNEFGLETSVVLVNKAFGTSKLNALRSGEKANGIAVSVQVVSSSNRARKLAAWTLQMRSKQ